jgi:hypothetical protein
MSSCPECDAALRRPGYCHDCGWDADLTDADDHGIDLPQGYADGDADEDEADYRDALAADGLGDREARAAGGGGDTTWFLLGVVVVVIVFVFLAVWR